MKAIIYADTKYLCVFLRKRLEVEGFSVDVSEDIETIPNAVYTDPPNFVIIQVSGSDGIEFDICGKIKKGDRPVPVVIISDNSKHAETASEAGADVFLKSPFSELEFMEVIGRFARARTSVLLVDDSRVIHQRTGGFLISQGFELHQAYNGLEGLELAKRVKPDIIISDIEMPEMDGFAMCKKIKNNDETALIPVIIVSSLGQGLDIDRGFNSGANDYLIKPVVHDELLSCINNLVHTMEVRRMETVMIVDDSPTILNMLKFGLMQQGFNVVPCTDGEMAYEKAGEIMPDVILADLDMPKLNGYQLVKYLKENKATRSIPIIIISSRDSRAEAARGLRIGASTFISKPFSMDKVLINVERLTAERRLIREREAMQLYISEAAMEAARQTSMGRDSSQYRATERNLTILFSDIVGFTRYCEKSDPMQAVSLLNDYFDIMTTVLKKHGAVIDKYIGDAIMSIFGVDESGVSPQLRAVRAALEMLEQQEEFNSTKSKPIQTRIGVNSGRVIFGDIGSRFYRRDFTVVGDPVNTAQRLQSVADPDQILISDIVYNHVKDSVVAVHKGRVSLKGKDTEIDTYEANGLK